MRERFTHWREKFRTADRRVRLGWWLLSFAVVNWPAAAAVCAWRSGWRIEPFEQLMVFYSLAALAFSAVTAILAAENGSDQGG